MFKFSNRFSSWMAAMVIGVALVVTGLHTALAAPASEECRGAIGAQRFENLIVPDGANCTLNGTRVDGNILVGSAATLATTAVQVGGNIQAEGASAVLVTGNTRVGGSVQIKQGGSAVVEDVYVNGDIQFESNEDGVRASANQVGGNVQIFQNRGGAQVSDNRINGNLQCKENSPPPTGGRNQAASLEDQCANLGGVPQNPNPTATPPASPTPVSTPTPASTPQRPIIQDGECRGTISGQRFENLDVPSGASCSLNGTLVDGNIKVGSNATLHAIEVAVGGNIQADGATDVTVHRGSSVGGNIQIKQGRSATVDQVRVIGDIQYESNNGALNVTNNRVGGNVQIFQNRGWIAITDNRIDGNLQCKENSPAPTGGRNQAASFEDQCAGFAGEPNIASPAPTPGTNDVTCQGVIGAQNYNNIIVPAGANCNLVGTRASGTVTVGSGAVLKASRLTVDGHVQAQGAAVVTLHDGSSVGGNVHIVGGDSATVDGVQVNGSVILDANQRALAVIDSQIGGNVQATGNQAGLVVRSNAITGSLACQDNTLQPLVDANQAGSSENQCITAAVRIFLPWTVTR